MLIYGVNPVLEALRAGRVSAIRIAGRADRRLERLLEEALSRAVPVERVDAGALDRAAKGGTHQGVVAELAVERPRCRVSDLVAGARAAPLLVVLDGVEDPQNVGAILRTCDAAGVDGVVRQTRRAARLEGAAARASAGAIAHVRIADVVNIARALDELRALDVWTVGLAGDAERAYDEIDLSLPTALVVGAEGSGLRRLVRERCDLLAAIPMRGHVESLNVSVATGVVLFEAVRQRRTARPAG